MANQILDLIDRQKPAQQTQQGLPTSLDDPRMQQAKDYVQNHGGNPKAAFYQLCKEKMVNPATIISQFMGGQM